MIGRTPLVRLRQFERETPRVELYAKAEWQNPGGSVKDRAAARMILDGEATGLLTPHRTITYILTSVVIVTLALLSLEYFYKQFFK